MSPALSLLRQFLDFPSYSCAALLPVSHSLCLACLPVNMSEYSAVPPPGSGAPLGGQAALGNGAGGIKKDAFADAVQRARQVRDVTG